MSGASAATQMTEIETSTAGPDERELYGEGSCHVFAAALARRYGWRTVVAIDPDIPYRSGTDTEDHVPGVVHCAVLDEDGAVVDVFGRRPMTSWSMELRQRFGVNRVTIEVVGSETALVTAFVDSPDAPEIDRPLHAYDDRDVEEADICATRILAPFLPGPEPAL